ncbi:MAG: ThiF family adenylyltransferase [Epsilonproteobacteria bacterium]|nr:ThiF family adenylyltransferase [Campylobacterota bacterium]
MFRRQIEILHERQDELFDKSIVIVGAGGLGCVAMSQLNCIGLKKIFVFDDDIIELHNIHRQFYFSKEDIGQHKATILAKKASRCQTQIIPINTKFEQLDEEVDLILDCSDNLSARLTIDSIAKQHNIAWVYAAVEQWQGQVCLFENKSFDIFNHADHSPKGVMPSMVGLIGSIQTTLAVKYLTKQDVKSDYLYYVEFPQEMRVMQFTL